MNAERFDSNEYKDCQKVDFIRVCQLSIGDRFMWQGTWFKVTDITEDRIKYTLILVGNRFSGSASFGRKCKMFVQVSKKV